MMDDRTIDRVAILQLRTKVRMSLTGQWWPTKWDGGSCELVSEALMVEFGWPVADGCYVTSKGKHLAHWWNVIDGRLLLDATADQFEDGDNVRLTTVNDARYDSGCGCGKDG